VTCRSHLAGDSASKIAEIADAATNTLIQTVGEELQKLGLRGGLGDDRRLRRVIRETIVHRLAEPENAHFTGASHDPEEIKRLEKEFTK